MNEQRQQLIKRITAYLFNGGFVPESPIVEYRESE